MKDCVAVLLTFVLSFSHYVVSCFLQPHRLQRARLPCPSLPPRVRSNSCPLSQWCHPTISPSVAAFSSCLQSYPASGFFSNESTLHIRWPKYWSFNFSISPSNEYSGFVAFRTEWFDLLESKGCSWVFSSTTVQKHPFFSAFFMVQLSHSYMTTGKTTALTI